MATALSEPAALPDAGQCRWCPHVQWSHKRGKGGCREMDCPCDRYTPPKTPPAPAAVVDEVVDLAEMNPAETLDDCGRCALIPSVHGWVRATQVDCPEHGGRAVAAAAAVHPSLPEVESEPDPVDEPEPAAELVVADPAAQADNARQVAAIDAQLAQPGPVVDAAPPLFTMPVDAWNQLCADVAHLREQNTMLRGVNRKLGHAEGEIARLKRDNAALVDERDTARREATEALNRAGKRREERDQQRRRADKLDADLRDAVAQRDQANERAAELEAELTRALAAVGLEPGDDLEAALAGIRAGYDRLRTDLDRAETAKQRAQDQYAEAIRVGVSAAANVLWRYDARQCETCGSRYHLDVEHEHPLTPVTVLVVRREVPDAA